ncbi:DUF4160 domain-containing protein [Mesorhizobium sp. ORS 3428]|uniref:DUF4160 domain-containing protein n=1 Tax=Mesorhizobium sp. ORS 3428 TaxID=540997 RepID=UPI0008D9D09A|nr:DUF4160 domain-containing protein [Mesorhizobium sp. ORS 3428]OHV86853.1 hypothetical protein ORS3428_06620 [Mesorhizobium sp. ORS 3428]
MYADDHVPPHFHVATRDGEALVSIDGLEMLQGSIDRRSLEAALEWAGENIETLTSEWRRLNER